MPRSLYDLLPDEVKAAHPPDSLDAPAARVLLRPGRVPDDYDPAKSAEIGRLLSQMVPRMTGMRTATNRVRAGQRGEMGEPPRVMGTRDMEPRAAIESATQRLYRGIRDIGTMTTSGAGVDLPVTVPAAATKAAVRTAAAAVQAVPKLPGPYTTRDLVPPAETPLEHVADIAGGTAGFMGTAAALGALGAGPALAAAGTGALQEGSLKERGVRAVALGTGAGLAHKAAGVVAGKAPGMARAAAAQTPGAVAFGAGVPWAEAWMHRLTGEPETPLPGGWDAAKGSAEMLAVNLLLGTRGIVRAGQQRVRGELAGRQAAGRETDARLAARRPPLSAPAAAPEAAPPVAPQVQRRAEAIAQAVAPPVGLTPRDVAAGRILTDRLNEAIGGKLVGLRLPGSEQVVPARVERVIAYAKEQGERVHLLVSDPTGSPVPVSFGSVEEMVSAVRPLPGSRSTPARAASEAAVGAVRSAPGNARLEAVEGKLARLTSNAPGKGAKGYRRWAQRVERLTAERDALRGSGSSVAPSPAPVAPAAPREVVPAERKSNPDADLDLFSEPPKAKAEPEVKPVGGGPGVVRERGVGTAAAEPAKPAPPKPKVADPGGVGKAGVEHPPMRDVSIAAALNESGAARAVAKAIREGKPDAEVVKVLGEHFGMGGGSTSGRTDFRWRGGDKPSISYRDESGKVVRVPAAALVKAIREGLAPPPAAEAPKPKPAKELEQAALEGMPAPKIPGGAKRAAFDESADIVKGMAEKPEAPKQEGLFEKAPERKGAGSDVSPESRFAGGERVRVPNETNRRHDKRSNVTGEVVGHATVRGEPAVIVTVNRGKSVTQHTFPERLVRKMPTAATLKAASEKRKAQSRKLTESLESRIGESAAKATAIAREYRAKADDAVRLLGDDTTPDNPQYANARRAWRQATAVAERATEIREKLLGGPGRSSALSPEVESAFKDHADAVAWTRPLREAADDHPAHFTPERQRDILGRVQRGDLPNAVEHGMAVEAERRLVEAGVPSEHAAVAVEATDRLRRFIHHERDNPLYEPAEAEKAVAEFEALLDPKRIGTPEGLKSALAEFDKRIPPSPADDVPAGVQELSNERGFLSLPEGVKTRHGYLAMLREVPKKFAAAVRAIPRKERPRVTDRHGNVVRRFPDFMVYDRFSEHAHARLLSAIAGGKFARIHDILTIPQRLAFKAITPDAVAWHGRLTDGWQTALAGRALDAHTGLSARISAVMDGEAPASSLPKGFRDLPEKFESNYQDMRMRRNEAAALYGVEPIYSFGVVKGADTGATPGQGGTVQWRVYKERDGKPIKFTGASGSGWYKVVGESAKGDALIVNTKAGEEPLTRYGGPHVVMGQTADAMVPVLEAVMGGKLTADQRIEFRDRFAGMRVGTESKVQDAVLQFEMYRDMNTRFLSMLPFLHRVRTDLTKMRGVGGDSWRAGLTEAWLRANLFPQRGGFDRLVDGAFRQALYSQRPFAGHTIGYEAARLWADSKGAKMPGWADAFFSVPADATIKETPGRLEVVAENSFGDRLVAAKGRGPIDVREVERRAGPLVWDAFKAASWAKVAQWADALPAGMTRVDFQRMLRRKYRYEAQRRYARPADAFYRAMGMNSLRAYLGGNIPSFIKNFLQPALTLAPDAGYRTTGAAMLLGATSREGVRAAERMGTLQGEVRRLQKQGHETRDRFKGLARMLLASGPMSVYRVSEDYTRGVSFLAAEAMARRLGIPFEAALREYEVGSKDYYENQAKIAEAIRKGDTGESLAALLDSQTMYDYDSMARPPIFGSGVGRLFGTLSTFSWNAAHELGLRPLAGAGSVAKATARGVADIFTGGAVGKAKPGARGGSGEHTFVRRSGETGAPLNQWLKDYGASEISQRHAVAWLKQTLAAGAVLGATVATGQNIAMAGTPGHEIITLYALRFLFGKDERIDAALKAALHEAQRSATWNPERGAPMGPIADAVVKALEGKPDPGEVVRGQVPLKAAMVRYLQNRQDAERLKQGGDLYWLAQALGIRSVTPSRSAGEEVQRNLGLQSRKKSAEGRTNTKKPKPRKRSPSKVPF